MSFISNKIKLSELKSPSRPTLLKIKKHILKRFNYSEIDELKRKQLNIKALHLVKQHCKPKIIFKELIKIVRLYGVLLMKVEYFYAQKILTSYTLKLLIMMRIILFLYGKIIGIAHWIHTIIL